MTCPICDAPALASFPAGTLYACQGAHGLGVAADIKTVERAAFKRGAEAMRVALLADSGIEWVQEFIREVPEPEYTDV